MTELNFSVMGDSAEDAEAFTRLLDELKARFGANLHLTRLAWDRAWQILLMAAMEAKGFDISQVGSTWGATLAALDSLRPFTEAEVASTGGSLAFVPAAWQTVRIDGRGEVWAMPMSVYTFVVFYRRDLFRDAGIDERVAFSTPDAMRAAFEAVHRNNIQPWTIPTKYPYLDLPHIASSWVRANGGEFIGVDGKQVLFNTPHARQGLVRFFELYRFLPAHAEELDYEDCLGQFFQGKTAALIAGTEAYSEALASNEVADEIHDQIGVAPLPGVSWIGGDHLVIWKPIRARHEDEMQAVKLIRELMTVENQARLARDANILPSRLDAYQQLEFQPDGMKTVLENILQTARPHPPLRLWRRIESFLVDMLCDIARSVVQFSQQGVEEIVTAKLADYERRLSLILSG